MIPAGMPPGAPSLLKQPPSPSSAWDSDISRSPSDPALPVCWPYPASGNSAKPTCHGPKMLKCFRA